MEVGPLVFDCAVFTGEVKPCPFPVARVFPLGAMFAASALDSVKTPLEKLWRFYVVSIMTGEIPFQTEIEACDFTRHGSVQVWLFMVGQHTDIDITNGIPLDGATFRIAKNIAGLEIAIDTLTDSDVVGGQKFPPSLGECERLVSAAWLETGTTHF